MLFGMFSLGQKIHLYICNPSTLVEGAFLIELKYLRKNSAVSEIWIIVKDVEGKNNFFSDNGRNNIMKQSCACQGVRYVRFSENLACIVFLKHPFWDSPFCLITDTI